MSDYYGAATLEDWLAEEVFHVTSVPAKIISLFARWRKLIEADIQQWMDTDEGDGCSSWCAWGRGFNAVPNRTSLEFALAVEQGKALLGQNPVLTVDN